MVFAVITLVHLAIAVTLDPHRRHPRFSSEHSDRVPPPSRTQPTSATAPLVEPLKQLIDTTRNALTSLVKHRLPEPWVCVIGVVITLLVFAIVTLSIKLRKLSIQHARTLDTHQDLRETIDELHVLAEKTLKTAQGLVETNRRTIESHDQALRLTEYFRDLATNLAEELEAIQPQNPIRGGIRQNGSLLPHHVVYGPAASTFTPAADVPAPAEVPVDPVDPP